MIGEVFTQIIRRVVNLKLFVNPQKIQYSRTLASDVT